LGAVSAQGFKHLVMFEPLFLKACYLFFQAKLVPQQSL
jgi:hypothetical protein